MLHIVDTSTHFSAAIFVNAHTTEHIWHCFLAAWAAAYTGYPNRVRVDQQSAFTSREFEKLCSDAGIEVQLSGVQSHNALGVGERYHEHLKRIFRKVMEDEPDLPEEIALQLSVKAMNDTVNPEGLVPSLLLFGTVPRFEPHSSRLPNHEARMRAMTVARREMDDVTARLKLQRALRSKLPPATEYVIRPGDNVYAYDERTKRYNGPFRVNKTFERNAWIQREDGERQYSTDRLLPTNVANGTHFIESLGNAIHHLCNKDNCHPRVFLTEVLPPNDSRSDTPEFVQAKEKELAGLLEKGTYEVVYQDDIPDDSNILGGRFVLSI